MKPLTTTASIKMSFDWQQGYTLGGLCALAATGDKKALKKYHDWWEKNGTYKQYCAKHGYDSTRVDWNGEIITSDEAHRRNIAALPKAC